MNSSRRNLCVSALAGLSALLAGTMVGAQAPAKTGAKVRTIKIQAKKFVYTPDRIILKKGESVILEFTSVDFVHGFHIPDMKVRADLMPGQLTRVPLTFKEAGEYAFLCDNFCGSGHEEMNGKIIVEA
jgi:cytochrome c oxidase subunit 2